MRIRVRILPLTIAVAVVLFTVRVSDLVSDRDGDTRSLSVRPLQAQQAGGNEGETGDPATAAPAAVAADDGAPGLLDEPPSDEDNQEPLLDAEEFQGGGGIQELDSAAISPAELEVLQSLRQRRRELDERERSLALREQMQRAAEHTLESRIEDLKKLKADVEGLLRQFDEEREAELKTLAVYYEKMKAKDAARVFNVLELTYLIDIVERMKDAKVAEIIGKMDTLKARELTTELVRRRTLPDTDEQSGQSG